MKLFTLLLLSFFTAAISANDNNEYTSDPYTIHYSVFNSTFVPPDVASAYQLRRGKNIGMINVSVRKKLDKGTLEKRAFVKGTKSDFIHTNTLDFIEIEEKGAIYYLASFQFGHRDTLNFSIEVQPDRNKPPISLQFSHVLYQDGKE